MPPADWQKSLEDLRTLYDQITVADGVAEIPARVATGIAVMTRGWDANRFVFTIGQLDAEKSAHLARAGIIEWWHASSGHGFFGDLDGLRKIHALHAADAGAKKETMDVSSTLSWSCFPHSVTSGVVAAMNPDVVKQLFDWGAKPDHEDSKYYKFALNGSPASVIAHFIDNGADRGAAAAVMNERLANKDYSRALQIQEALKLGGYFSRVDNNTVVETKFLNDADGPATLKTIYNFAARRVNEIYERDKMMTMTATNFEHYDAGALRRAQEVLEKLGGKPDDVLDKPKLAVIKNG